MRKEGGTVRHVICDDVATLVYLANQACLTPHTWLSRADKPQFPDQMIFDIDPSTDDLGAVIEAAHTLKELLDDVGLPAYVRATGSRGLHVATPLDRTQEFEAVRGFARKLAEIAVARNPTRYTLEQSKAKRRGRVFLDLNRNAYAQTVVAVYAVRPRKGAPVSVPLEWDELEKKNFRPDGVTIHSLFERLDRIVDPWKDFWRHAASLDKARRKLEHSHAT
jgi:bifunctional non-homologous end joining protein LigD